MIKICIDCSGDYKEWTNGRSKTNPVHTDFCSICNHRNEVICYSPNKNNNINNTQHRSGLEYYWTTISGKEHGGTIIDIDNNVIIVQCKSCNKECCTEL